MCSSMIRGRRPQLQGEGRMIRNRCPSFRVKWNDSRSRLWQLQMVLEMIHPEAGRVEAGFTLRVLLTRTEKQL